jgi:NAD(P)-dependent dehydrogenase (short-subunit alcohol dehydrogenase family)
MKMVVITGSTRGIGLGFAKSFLDLGCAVAVSGRLSANVDSAVETLRKLYATQPILGMPCDVREINQVRAMWEAARKLTGWIDIWINNAGLSNPMMKIWESPPEEIQSVIDTNLLGTIYGSMVAVQGMLQQGAGSVYNVEGMGSDGRKHDGLTFYGMSKYGLRYFNESLVSETRGTPVLVGSIRPGMVVTDMITSQFDPQSAEWQRVKRIFNILAERVDVVTPRLAQQILANQKHGAVISYQSRGKLILRFLTAPFNKRNLFSQAPAAASDR